MQPDVMKAENWDDAARLGVAVDDYTPLSLGSTVIGWVPLHHPISNPESSNVSEEAYHLSKVVMGCEVYDFDRDRVWNDARRLIEDEKKRIADFISDIDCDSDIILNLPVGALNLDSESNSLASTEHNSLTLYDALCDYFRLRDTYIQSELHKQTPQQVMETILSLHNHHCPWKLLEGLTWRGKLLDSLPEESQMMYMTQLAGENSAVASPAPLKEEVHSFMNFFTNFIAIGSAENSEKPKWKWDSMFKPENVFFLKAVPNSKDEQLLGEMLFDDYFLNAYLDVINHESDPQVRKVFFFAAADDSLSDWVMGTTILVSEMHETLSTKGIF